ncbi:Enoyl-CoA delta isomerase 2-like 3 [Homarus americanus]|uniref:Enoyl-CoA delta isomerase 2-like 3 n=1 Tax=Homarus americanus TaxID=6706 RepID=A0A8J5JMW7_HOMAM|nr:Enoyl-CoA delta isomerase 2-like 3 [Homarus americanus]
MGTTSQHIPTWTGITQVRLMSVLSPQFEEAKAKLGSLKEDPGNDVKLKIYALFKQSTSGAVTTKRPGMMDFESKGEAQAASGQKYKTILVSCENGLRIITLNRPEKKNAITVEWIEALKEAGEDPNTVITAITGSGDYYCSGNDLSNFTNIDPSNMHQYSQESGKLLNRFVNAFIDFPKPLIAVVNGPAIGVSVTVMGMFDAVYASDKFCSIIVTKLLMHGDMRPSLFNQSGRISDKKLK